MRTEDQVESINLFRMTILTDAFCWGRSYHGEVVRMPQSRPLTKMASPLLPRRGGPRTLETRACIACECFSDCLSRQFHIHELARFSRLPGAQAGQGADEAGFKRGARGRPLGHGHEKIVLQLMVAAKVA